MRCSSITRTILKILFSMAIFLLVLEGCVAIFLSDVQAYTELIEDFGAPFPLYPATYSDYLPFTLPPNMDITMSIGDEDIMNRIQTNELGYRGPAPTTIEKPPDTTRILFLGDSFTLGWGVEEHEAFPAQVGERLADQGPTIEAINAGYRAGYSPDAYYAYMLQEGLALEPDVVIVSLFTGNDVGDMRDNSWLETDESSAPTRLMTYRSYIDYRGQMLNPGLLPWNYHVPLLRESRAFVVFTEWLNNNVLSITTLGSLPDRMMGPRLSAQEAWDRFTIVMQALTQLSERHDFELVYVLIARPELDDSPRVDIENFFVYELDQPYLVTHDLLRPEHLIPGDGHLTPEGHAVVANVLFDVIEPLLSEHIAQP